jgi:hypothetical protein
MPVSHRELIKRFPIEAHPVTGALWSDRRALLQDQRVLDVSIEPKSVRLKVRAVWTDRRRIHTLIWKQPRWIPWLITAQIVLIMPLYLWGMVSCGQLHLH